MQIDREHIKKEFAAYAGNYNLEDPKILLKYEHTYRVASFCERIARSLGLSAQDVDLAWTIGMFHDIGRFEQVRQFHTFRDKDSVNHAELSADLLFLDGLVKNYVKAEREELQLMELAVRCHNRYRLPEELSERERMFCSILRDADKIDILRVNCETPREEIYDLPAEAFTESEMTDEIYYGLLKHQEVDRTYSKTGIDFIMGHIGFVFGLVFEESRIMVKEQGFLVQLLSFESSDPETKKRMEEVRKTVLQYLEK